MPDLGDEIRALFAREDYALGVSARMLRILRLAYGEVAARLSAGDLDGPRSGHLTALFRDLDRIIGEGYRRMNTAMVKELTAYHGVEANAALAEIAGMGNLQSGVLLSRPLVAAIADLPIDGRNLGDWWQRMAAGMGSKVRAQVQLGLTLGEAGSRIARRVLQARNVDPATPELWRQARRDVVSFVRTATNAVHNAAALGTYRALGEQGVVRAVRFRAVLDSRTTPICRGFDGRTFALNDPGLTLATPPLHIACRSTLVPVVIPKALGLKSIPQSLEAASWRGYESWLRNQERDVQRAVLGDRRVDLFTKQGVTLTKMLTAGGTPLTLEQLRARLARAA